MRGLRNLMSKSRIFVIHNLFSAMVLCNLLEMIMLISKIGTMTLQEWGDVGSNSLFLMTKYEGQSINSENGSISQKILIESEWFILQNVNMGNAYLCLKNGVFITTKFDAMRICIQHCEWPWSRKSSLDPFLFGGRVIMRCSMFVWIVISMVAYVSEYTSSS